MSFGTQRTRALRAVAALAVAPALASVLIPCAVHGQATATSAPATVQAASAQAGDWTGYNGNLANDRFSPLAEITAANVGRLRRVCTFDTGDTTSFEVGPVAVNGVLYVTTYANTFAIDGATCALRWRHHRDAPAGFLRVNRGVGYADGRLFRGSTDAHVYALDAASGRTLWDVPIGDPTRGETVPMAPVVWNGLVFVGNAGGDEFGVTGRVHALDAATGREVWRFHTVADTGAVAATWLRRSAQNPPTGGAFWTSFAVDTSRGVLYVPTGNAAPDFAEQLHPGDNLYTTAIVALDARSGRLLGYVQPIKHDFHDHDIATAPALITTRGGRSLVAAPGKDGLLYGIDRSGVDRVAGTGAAADGATGPSALAGAAGPNALVVRYQTPTTTRSNLGTPLRSDRDTRFCPGSQGGTEWGGPAYNAALNLLFVNAVDWCTTVRLARLDTLKGVPGQAWTGEADPKLAFGRMDPKGQWQGWLTAADADNGQVRWKYRSATPLLAPVTATAGGLVLTGDLNGDVLALDAASGRVLWRDATRQAIGAGVTSYRAGGRQRIAVPAGLSSPIWPVTGGPARVYVYALP